VVCPYFPGPTVLEADLHAALQKIIEYVKIEEDRLQARCDGAMVARQIADLEVASSSLAHSSRYFPPFFFFPFPFFFFSFFSFFSRYSNSIDELGYSADP
jgi:hypothetical protein